MNLRFGSQGWLSVLQLSARLFCWRCHMVIRFSGIVIRLAPAKLLLTLFPLQHPQVAWE
jgi:hypothetical protein